MMPVMTKSKHLKFEMKLMECDTLYEPCRCDGCTGDMFRNYDEDLRYDLCERFKGQGWPQSYFYKERT